ncbi:ferritin-like domain-containing protein [Actinokineospora sp. HUAS TT18]|uniref:ferritin-like domain-containing protein n=1 Tax=Actinokineospora sp. HUAS TT18 TaxID=3447451 RepID=UPI003F526B40
MKRWVRHFEVEAARRSAAAEPEWTLGARLHPAVVRSVQRFQVGEDGDGANLIAKADAAGDADYARAARMFVAEEQEHARLLAALLAAAGARTITGHWSDAVFVRLRRALGLTLELKVLMIAEVIALVYYRTLRDGTSDPLTTAVAGRILADERRHVPFHLARLGPRPRALPLWRALFCGVALVVALDHGPALHALGTTRRDFVAACVKLFWGLTRRRSPQPHREPVVGANDLRSADDSVDV